MKTQTIPLLLFSLTFLALALYLVPTVAAQEEGNMLADGVQWITDGAGNLWNQASTFVSEQPVATGALATTGGLAGGLGWAYRGTSKAKNMLAGQVSGLTTQIKSATEEAQQKQEELKTQLSTLQTSTQTQLSELQTKAETAQTSAEELKTKLEKKVIANEQLQELYNSKIANNTIVKKIVV